MSNEIENIYLQGGQKSRPIFANADGQRDAVMQNRTLHAERLVYNHPQTVTAHTCKAQSPLVRFVFDVL